MFDGSDTSISGDGKYHLHGKIYIPDNENKEIPLPPQNGGGCINSGPFVK